MKHKLTIIIAVMEAVVLLTMKLMDWRESKDEKPAAGKVHRAGGRRVVNPSPPEYNDRSPEGERSAINFLASSSAADEEVHKEE